MGIRGIIGTQICAVIVLLGSTGLFAGLGKNDHFVKDKEAPDFILDIAVELAKGTSTPETAQKQMLPKFYKWLSTPGNIAGNYNPGKWHIDPNGTKFKLNQFIHDPLGGNCADASALYQCCCASLGIPTQMRRLNAKGKPRFSINNFYGFGHSQPSSADFDYHQIAFLNNVFDPTNKSTLTPPSHPPEFAVDMPPIIQDAPIGYITWFVSPPDMPYVSWGDPFTVQGPIILK